MLIRLKVLMMTIRIIMDMIRISVADPHSALVSGYGSGSRIFCQCGSGSGSKSRSRVLMTKNWKKFTAEKNCLNQKLQFTYPLASIKDVQASGELFIPQKRTSSTSKLEISSFLLFILALLDPDPADQNECGSVRIRIRILNTDYDYDDDGKGCALIR
jgi:hypothetical protein